ncbi:unnamed protein product [Pleuronectes platessa]|uniref:Uncharacterized protein n=1 Tax=Pleuronectes platessa TaxID=8262 RepID=A0A9N7VVQ9_PLEPL|nr:unnamed protein product [Pleuronectes platessa]
MAGAMRCLLATLPLGAPSVIKGSEPGFESCTSTYLPHHFTQISASTSLVLLTAHNNRRPLWILVSRLSSSETHDGSSANENGRVEEIGHGDEYAHICWRFPPPEVNDLFGVALEVGAHRGSGTRLCGPIGKRELQRNCRSKSQRVDVCERRGRKKMGIVGGWVRRLQTALMPLPFSSPSSPPAPPTYPHEPPLHDSSLHDQIGCQSRGPGGAAERRVCLVAFAVHDTFLPDTLACSPPISPPLTQLLVLVSRERLTAVWMMMMTTMDTVMMIG